MNMPDGGSSSVSANAHTADADEAACRAYTAFRMHVHDTCGHVPSEVIRALVGGLDVLDAHDHVHAGIRDELYELQDAHLQVIHLQHPPYSIVA